VGCATGYLLLWATGALGILLLSQLARDRTPEPPGTVAVRGIHHFQPVDRAGRLWRGSAPSPEGYRRLARLRFTIVVDLRAEELTARQPALPKRAGLRVVRLSIRDGQTPGPGKVDRFLDVVRHAPGPVFVHCGAGGGGPHGHDGRRVSGPYGRGDRPRGRPPQPGRRPPSLEQIYYALTLTRDRAAQPPLPVVALSRLIDAPRRIWSRLR
jgi:hypothetical protein